MTPTIAEVTDEADIATCLALRIAVFVGEQGVSMAEEVDGLDATSRHFLARAGDIPVATLRLRVARKTAKLQRICVAKGHRGTGLGAAITRAALDAAAQSGATTARLDAQTTAIPFYERLGFRAQGPKFDDAGIPHRAMTRPL